MADWANYPMNAEVFWPKDEKIIGVLGLGPVATADFYARLVSRRLEKDWQHPRVLIDGNTKIPSRGRHLALGEADPVPYIVEGIAELRARGADFVVIPCNTAHVFYDHFARNASVPVPNIIDVTTLSAVQRAVQHPIVLCNDPTRDYRLYEIAFAQYHIEAVQFPDQTLIMQGIEAVKQNLKLDSIVASIHEMMDAIPNIDSIILGCTEISVLMNHGLPDNYAKKIIDSNQELAVFCLDFAFGKPADPRIRMSA